MKPAYFLHAPLTVGESEEKVKEKERREESAYRKT